MYNFIFFLVIFSLLFSIGGLCTEYVIEFWVPYISHEKVDVSFIMCGFAGIFLSEITIPAAILTFIINSFITSFE
jgi:hypothetical protein